MSDSNLSITYKDADGKIYTFTGTGSLAIQMPAQIPPPPAYGLFLLPAGIKPTIVSLDALGGWTGEHDGGTGGTAMGTTTYPVAIGGRNARAFPSIYTKNGGLRYHVHYATDTVSKNFIYAGDLWFDNELPAQMELDNNQTDPSQKTYIFGVQCNKNSGKWDITKQDTGTHWVPSVAKGDPTQWPTKKWLHFEILAHRDDAGNISYDEIYFDGVTQRIGQVLASARKLNPVWSVGSCLVNVQVGGASAIGGSIALYGNGMQVARW